MEFAAMGRLEVRITVHDVGKRISVRRLADTGDSDGRFTDTVGILTSWDDGTLVVTRRTGERVHIAESSLVAGKVVPGAPVRRRGPSASYAELARVTARAWQPVESEPLGDWVLRAAVRRAPGTAGTGAVGFTRRANSVLPLGDPGLPLPEALSAVRAWYARRGLPPYIQTATGTAGAQERLCADLEAAGWRREVTAELRTAPLAPLADPAGDRAAQPARVRLHRDVDEGWLRRYNRSGGPGGPAAEPGGAVRTVLAAGPSVWFASVPGEAPEVPVAIGRCVVDGRWAGFMAVEVDPAARRRGLATAVMTALARRALDEGASAAWLQVESDNTGARALYDGMGFDVHHSYHHYRG
ncbi:GNAT family N-acetyltransferase [Streptomyces sulfonofaciens]|uniref:GNAT family N-acetyltransferase n=1 Tax=Streptomyces sulfonofaciens TaxID=68272 RepID=UPI001675637B|nr:GNAT family N-acetyltransferase [Streptomyces sulfonofaciens]